MFDFSALSSLWETPVSKNDFDTYANQNEKRGGFLVGLGSCFAGLHDFGLLPDAHEDNFVGNIDRVALVDYGRAQIIRGGPIGTVQRAENLVGIMLGLSPVEWVLFKHGYTTRGVQAAQSTINYIEGVGFPWSLLIAEGRYRDAIDMILSRMEQAFSTEEEIRFNADLGYCYSHSGDQSAAVRYYQSALHACSKARMGINDTTAIHFGAMKAALRAGDRERTIAFSEEISYAADAQAQAGSRAVVDTITDPRIIAEAAWYRREIAAFDKVNSDYKKWDTRLQQALQQCKDNRLESLLPSSSAHRPGDIFSAAREGVQLW